LLEAFSETGEPVPFAYTNRQSLSADGRYLAFAGIIEANVYTGGPNDFGVWVRDSCRGADPSCVPSTVRASINVNGQPLTGDYYIGFAMSASGRYIAFTAYDGVGNVLLRDTCIGAPSGCVPVTTKLFSRGQSTPYGLSISADGQRVAFAMWHFDLYSQTLSSHVFALDTCAGVAVCAPRAFLVSSDPSGSVGNGLSVAPMISGDGKSVVFQSDASNLVPGDTNGVSDIFRTVLP
jgi:Tol biopolymer transport system component